MHCSRQFSHRMLDATSCPPIAFFSTRLTRMEGMAPTCKVRTCGLPCVPVAAAGVRPCQGV